MDQRVIRRHTNIKSTSSHLLLDYSISFLFGRDQIDHAQSWSPFPKLSYPVGYRALRCNDQMRSIFGLLIFMEVTDECDGHYGLPHAHLICQQSIDVIVVQRDRPLQKFQLMRLQFTCLSHHCRLLQVPYTQVHSGLFSITLLAASLL